MKRIPYITAWIGCAVLMLLPNLLQANAENISLAAHYASERFHVGQNMDITMSNDNAFRLFDLTVTKEGSSSRILTIKEFPQGESVSLSFSKSGEYAICYWHGASEARKQSCLGIRVMALSPA